MKTIKITWIDNVVDTKKIESWDLTRLKSMEDYVRYTLKGTKFESKKGYYDFTAVKQIEVLTTRVVYKA